MSAPLIRRLLAPLALFSFAGMLGGCPGNTDTCESRGLELVDWYQDRDRDTFGNRNIVITACSDEDPSLTEADNYVLDATDCDDLRPEVFPQGVELCDGLDNNCNGAVDDGLPFNDFWIDEDGDGFGNPALQVESCSVPENGADQPGDCDDSNAAINPDAQEICNTLDDDCDTLIDDEDDAPRAEGGVDLETGSQWRPDVDGDGFGNWNEDSFVWACEQPEGFVADTSDCNDADPVINPGNQEVCNGIDDDCDQLFDDSDDSLDASTQTLWFRDVDADGYGVPDESLLTCTTPWFYALTDDDCDDSNPLVLNATDTTWVLDGDGDGFGAGEVSAPSCTPPTAQHVSVVNGIDCADDNPDIFPGQVEICDTLDNDCDDLIDDDDLWFEEGGVDVDSMTAWFTDGDADGYGDPADGFLACAPIDGEVADATDCLDGNPDINPGAVELCDGFDNDCDFLVDDDDDSLDVDSGIVFTRDADGDGWGDLDDVIRSCEEPEGYTADFGDCDDSDPSIGLPGNWWFDSDGDGQGAGDLTTPATCESPGEGYVPWYIDLEPDCDPDDPFAMSGPEICYDGIDQDCDGLDYVVNGVCELDLPATCLDAQNFAPLIPGGQIIEGDLSGTGNDLDTTNAPSCISPNASQSLADEVLLPVLVPDGNQLRVTHKVNGGDSVVYLLTDCFAVTSCVGGANSSSLTSGTETLYYTNDTGAEQLLYVVADGRRTADSRTYRLTIDLIVPNP